MGAEMRIAHWEAILFEALEAARKRPFAWGSHDCATWAFDVRCTITGIDSAAEWRGRYDSAFGAARMLTELDSADVEDLARRYLGEPLDAVRLAQRGDIALADVGHGPTLGVVAGARAAFVAPDGLVSLRLDGCRLAWPVGR